MSVRRTDTIFPGAVYVFTEQIQIFQKQFVLLPNR